MKIQRLNSTGKIEPIEEVDDAEGHRLAGGGACRIVEFSESSTKPVEMKPIDAPDGLPEAKEEVQRVEVIHKFEDINDG